MGDITIKIADDNASNMGQWTAVQYKCPKCGYHSTMPIRLMVAGCEYIPCLNCLRNFLIDAGIPGMHSARVNIEDIRND